MWGFGSRGISARREGDRDPLFGRGNLGERSRRRDLLVNQIVLVFSSASVLSENLGKDKRCTLTPHSSSFKPKV